MTFYAWRNATLANYAKSTKTQRRGQFLMNSLPQNMYDLVMSSNEKHGFSIDPFHNDDFIDNFLAFVEQNWEVS